MRALSNNHPLHETPTNLTIALAVEQWRISMRQFLVIEARPGEVQVGEVEGLSHGVFRGCPAHGDSRYRNMVVMGSTESEEALLANALKIADADSSIPEPRGKFCTPPKVTTVEQAVEVYKNGGWVVLEFLTKE
jgi:hypothetical protein